MGEPLLALGLLVVAYGGVRMWVGWRRRHVMRAGAADLVTSFRAARADTLVLVFGTPECVPCKTVQRPALDALLERFPGRVTVAEVDALQAPDLVQRFGILTVPSTVVIGADGGIRAINHGTATTDRLATQAGFNGATRSIRPRRKDARPLDIRA